MLRWLPIGLAACILLAPRDAAADLTLLRTIDGNEAGDECGYAVVAVGDMDGDHIGDYAIGVPGGQTGAQPGEGGGYVWIYRGGDPFPVSPACVVAGEPGTRLGHSLAAADIDGDGLSDLIIGAPGRPETPETLDGQVIIVFGAPTIGSRPLAQLLGTTPGGRFGWSVAGFQFGGNWGAGLRVLVGAPEANDGAGEVHGLTYSDVQNDTRSLVLHGTAPGEHFGQAVADAGLMRGFSFGPEFIVGTPDASAGNGRFDIFYVDAVDDTLPDITHAGPVGGHLGSSVTGGQDINRNGFEPGFEIAVGGPGALGSTGMARVYGDQIYGLNYWGDTPGERFGATVRLLEDVTGTNLPDFAVRGGESVRIYPGPLEPATRPLATLVTEAPGDSFGFAISNAARIRTPYVGSAHSEFIIGAPAHGGKGRAYIYGDPTAPTSVAPRPIEGITLSAPGPNPSAGSFALGVDLARAAHARVAIVDVSGRAIARLHDGRLPAGHVEFRWTPESAHPPGLYWAVLDADGTRATRALVRVR